jgi:YfiH family protein
VTAIPAPFGDQPAPALRVDAWPGDAPAHGFFGRHGGFSGGELGSLNLSERVGDRPWTVGANWTRVRLALPGLEPVRMQQVHGVHVVRVGSPSQRVGDADAMLTTEPGVGLVVLTADCVSVLAYAPGYGAVLAAHAGWKGSLAGVTVAALEMARSELAIPPAAWRVALGPAIGGCCYEVEAEIGQRFVDRWGDMADAWQAAGSHGRLDLRKANRAILVSAGVDPTAIVEVGPCTSCAAGDYFSHRHSAGLAGRQASIIGLLAGASESPV